MNSILFFFRTMIRESRGSRSRLFFFGACIAVGVAAIVGVAALIDSLEAGLRQEARSMLGADMVISSKREIPEHQSLFTEPLKPFEYTQVITLPTMSRSAAGTSRLVELKAIEGEYPLRGELNLIGTDASLYAALKDDSIMVEQAFLAALKVEVGDKVNIGLGEYTVAGIVGESPSKIGFTFSMGPRVFMSRKGLEKAALLGFGHRVEYEAMYRFSDTLAQSDLKAGQRVLREKIPGAEHNSFVNVNIHSDAQPALRRIMDQIEKFLGLIALLSLLLGSVGVSQIVKAWITQKTLDTAVLRCLGFRPIQVMLMYLTHILLLAVISSVIGGLVGLALPWLFSQWQPDIVPPKMIQFWQPMALLRGVGLGMMVAILFSLPPLSAVRRVPPSRVLRSDVKPLPVAWWLQGLVGLLIFGGVFFFAWVQGRSVTWAMWFTVGLIVMVWLLWTAAFVLVKVMGKLPRRGMPAVLRNGLAALSRSDGSGMTGSMTALGVGVMVVVAVTLVQLQLGKELETVMPEDAANVYLWDIQKTQLNGVKAELEKQGAVSFRAVPVVTARIKSVDGVALSELVKRKKQAKADADAKASGKPKVEEQTAEQDMRRGRRRMFLTREQRVTWLEEISPDNRIVEKLGPEDQLWSDPNAAEVSLEEGFARNIGAKLGSEVIFDIQGIPMTFKVTSLRTVEWRSFDINFFITAEPGVLDKAPHIMMGAVNIPPEKEDQLQDTLAATYPNVVMLRVRQMVAKASDIVNKILLAIRLLGGFTVIAGLVILAGAIATTQLKRARESAVLKTMGVSRSIIIRLFGIEYAIAGLVAGGLGTLGAWLLARAFMNEVLKIEGNPSFLVSFYAVIIVMVLTVLSGLMASMKAIVVKPLSVLRGM